MKCVVSSPKNPLDQLTPQPNTDLDALLYST
jgi:hypothetical protein